MANPSVKKLPVAIVLSALLACIPLTASANAGTPLMWAAMLHLVIGNAVIGLFEGLVLAKFYKLKSSTCVLILIGANYFSAWIGRLLIGWGTEHLTLNLYNAWIGFWAMALLTFLATLILEWPFVLYCFRKDGGRLKKSIRGNLMVNGLSYLLLFGWYWMASGTTLYTKMKIVHPTEMEMPQAGMVYFISENNDVCSFDLNTKRIEPVQKLDVADKNNRLFVRHSALNTNLWDIGDTSKQILVCSNLNVVAKPFERDDNLSGTWMNFGEAARLGDAQYSPWNFRTGFWPIEGLHGANTNSQEDIRFSLETPFVAWNARNATHLPGDYVVFQLGKNQICLLEAATRKITLLTKGRGPVVVLLK